MNSGRDVLILEPRLDRAELLASACEEAAPDVAWFQHIPQREDVFDLLAERSAVLLAAADDAAGFETILRVLRLFPNQLTIAVTADDDPSWEARLVQEGVGDVLMEGEIDGRLLARRVRQSSARSQLREAQSQFPLLDPLTGFMNRDAFLFLGDRKVAKAQQRSKRAAVASVEVAGWREILLTRGALAADEAVMSAADALRPARNRRGLAARVAPASFAFLFTDAEANAIHAEISAANSRFRQMRGAGAPNAACRWGIAESRKLETLSQLLDTAQSSCRESIVAFAAGT